MRHLFSFSVPCLAAVCKKNDFPDSFDGSVDGSVDGSF